MDYFYTDCIDFLKLKNVDLRLSVDGVKIMQNVNCYKFFIKLCLEDERKSCSCFGELSI